MKVLHLSSYPISGVQMSKQTLSEMVLELAESKGSWTTRAKGEVTKLVGIDDLEPVKGAAGKGTMRVFVQTTGGLDPEKHNDQILKDAQSVAKKAGKGYSRNLEVKTVDDNIVYIDVIK